MTITLNNKEINIPDNQIAFAMKKLDISAQEAVEMWLDDHDYTINAEQEQLDEKAQNVKIDHGAQSENKQKTAKKRVKKPNLTKKAIITAIFEGLNEKIDEISSISITNDEKYINFELDNVSYTINLVAHRSKKA